jgi:hypothetical protein
MLESIGNCFVFTNIQIIRNGVPECMSIEKACSYRQIGMVTGTDFTSLLQRNVIYVISLSKDVLMDAI